MALIDFKIIPGIDNKTQPKVQKTVGLIVIMLGLDMDYQKKLVVGLL